MYNWNAHLRGTGFPVQPQPLMPGTHMAQMAFQPQAPHWAQHQQPGMGMVMGPGWPPVGQPGMFPPHGMLPGLMTMPMTTMMGGLGPAPPSQPPPPLPAEPPPPSPKVPPPPPPPAKDSASPVMPEQKKSKWDQPNREQPSSAGNAAPPHQPKPPQSPAPGQVRPSQSPALGSAPKQVNPHGLASSQVNPRSSVPDEVNPHGPAPGQVNPHSSVPDQVNPHGPAPGQVNPHSSVPNQVNPHGPAPGQVNPHSSVPNQVNPYGPAPGQVNPHSSVPNQVNPHGPLPGQVNPHGLAPGQVNLHGLAPGQANLHGLAPGQANLHGLAPGHANLHGLAPDQVNPRGLAPGHAYPHGLAPDQVNSHPVAGHPLPPRGLAADLINPPHRQPTVPPAEKTVPADPVLVAELEKVKQEEAGFLEQYKQWKKQYDDWRQQNQNHPNKEQFEQYLQQWKSYEQQMEARRTAILMQKQSIEYKLSQPPETPISKTGPTWMETGAPSKFNTGWDMNGQDTSSVSPLSQGFSVSSQDRENRLVAADSVAGHFQRYDSSRETSLVPSERRNQLSESGNGANDPAGVHNQGSSAVEEEKGEEDMNLEDDEEGGGGIIESGQDVSRSVWSENPTDKNSFNQRPDGDWNMWNKVPDIQSQVQWGDSFGGAIRDTGWSSHRGFQEADSFRGRGRGRGDQRATFGSGGPGVGSGGPGVGSGAPGVGSGAPGVGSGAPGVGSGASGVGSGAPGVGSGPSGGSSAPSVGSGAPGMGSGGPGVGSGGPGVDRGAPDVGSGGPGVGSGALGVGSGEPGVDSGEPGIDIDSRFPRPAGGNELQEDEECAGEEFDGEVDDGTVGSVDHFQSWGGSIRGRGQWHRGVDSYFQRGRGSEFPMGRGDFLRGRGSDFQRGRGSEFPMGREDFQRGRGSDFQRGRGNEFPMGREDFQRGRGSDFQRGRGSEFPMGRGDFLRGRGSDFQRGRGSEFPMGRGDFLRGRGSDFQRVRGAEFQRARGAEFQRGRSGEFQRDRRFDYDSEDGERMFDHSLDFEREGFPPRGRREFPSRGRGALPSLLSFEFSESMRHKFADFGSGDGETYEAEESLRGDTNFGDICVGQEGVTGREAQRYFDDDDDYDSRFFPSQGRGVGIRRGVVRGRGMSGFRGGSKGLLPEHLDGDNPTDLNLAQRAQGAIHSRGGMVWRGGSNHSSFTDIQQGEDNDRRFVQSGRAVSRGEHEIDRDQFVGDDQFEKSDEFGLRDSVPGSMRGQRVDSDRSVSDTRWHGQQDSGIPERYDHRNQQVSEAAAGNVQMSERARGRQVPGEDEPEVKKRRLSLEEERDEIRVHKPPYSEDLHRLSSSERQPYREHRGPFLRDPYAVHSPYGIDQPGFDRFGPKSSVYESLLERKPLIPAQTIDYGHGGIDREKKVVQPAEVIDYGHGQSHEGKAAELGLDRDRVFHGGLGDRSSAAFLRAGGPEMRTGRDVQELTKVSEFRDRDPSYRRPDMATRVAHLGKYSLRGDEFAGHDHRRYEGAGSEPVSGRNWYGDSRDGDRVSTRERDKFGEEDEHYRGNRMTRFSSRDDDWDSREDGLARDTDPIPAGRGRYSYSEKDDEYYARKEDSRLSDSYLDRSGEFIQDRAGVGDSYLPARDSRYGSSGTDLYSHEDRDGYSRPLSPSAQNITPLRASAATPPQIKPEIVKVEDLLCPPNRENRPPQIVTIIRGLPGSGKTYVSKLLREKEISCGGAAPRMLCLDDYFMVEQEREVVDPDTGKKVKKRVLEYEYEQELEDAYRQGLLKSFKKTVDDGFFPFIIIDATNEKVVHFSEFWSYAKSKGFQVYVGELSADIPTCIQRNIHNWTEWDIEKVKNNWEPLPSHYIRLDLRWLLQEDSIPEVVMEDTQAEEGEEDKEAEEDEEDSDSKGVYKQSKWELDTSEETLDKLDGIRVSKKHIAEHQSLNDYLQLDQLDDDYFSRESLPGKKRVRWADLEEKKNQSRRRNLGFIVGQTQQDWARITDDDFASKALNQTKYFYKN